MADEKKKNMNKLTIEGDYDKLAQIMQMAQSRLGTNNLKFAFADNDEEERKKLTVPETQVNTTERLRRVQESGSNAQMAPNLVDPAAFPNDNLDKIQRSLAAGGDDYKERKEIAHKENEEQVQRMEKKVADEPNRAGNTRSAAHPSNQGGSPSGSEEPSKSKRRK